MVIAVCILSLAAVIFLLILRYLFRRIFYNSEEWKQKPMRIPTEGQYAKDVKRITELIRGVQEQPFEEVWIRSRDGLKLYGRYYHIPGHPEDCPLHIQFHGYHGSAQREFAGCRQCEWTLAENPCDTLLVDQRAHGKSEGNVTCFGIRERYDAADWAKYACARFGGGRPLILSGVSMGAAAVLMAADLPDLPASVIGIVADSPYDTPKDIICKVVNQMHLPLPTGLIWRLIDWSAVLYGHFRLNASSAVASVRHTDIPILIFHGDDDRYVPYQMSGHIRDACRSSCELEIFPGAAHGTSFLEDPERYVRVLDRFIGNSKLDR